MGLLADVVTGEFDVHKAAHDLGAAPGKESSPRGAVEGDVIEIENASKPEEPRIAND